MDRRYHARNHNYEKNCSLLLHLRWLSIWCAWIRSREELCPPIICKSDSMIQLLPTGGKCTVTHTLSQCITLLTGSDLPSYLMTQRDILWLEEGDIFEGWKVILDQWCITATEYCLTLRYSWYYYEHCSTSATCNSSVCCIWVWSFLSFPVGLLCSRYYSEFKPDPVAPDLSRFSSWDEYEDQRPFTEGQAKDRI